MRYGWLAGALLLSAVPALGLDPDPARQAATVYLDGLAEQALAARAHAMAGLDSKAAAERRQAQTRAKVLALIGGLPDRSNPLKARLFSSHKETGFLLENVAFESLPGLVVTANVYVPEGKGPFPAILISPGHSPLGKASDYTMAAGFARAGFLVLTYDILGEGERLQHYDADLNLSKLERPTAEHSLAAYQSLLVGQPVVRTFLNDAMRGIDYLQSRSDVDAARIGAFGCSGGGAVTAYVAALDPRIKAAASACFVTTMHELLKSIGPQEGEQSTPGFTAAGLDLVDWVELAAPRPYAIVSTTEDMFPFAGARIAHGEAKKFWSLMGAPDKLVWITGPGRHGALMPIASDIVGFFVQNLKGGGPKPEMGAAHPAQPDDVLVTETGQLSTSLGGETVQSLVKAEAARLAPSPSLSQLQRDIRQVTRASGHGKAAVEVLSGENRPAYRFERLRFSPAEGPAFEAVHVIPTGAVKGRFVYLDRSPLSPLRLEALTRSGWEVLAPVPAGGSGEEGKAAVLGDYTLFALRTMLVDRTITGLRIDQAMASADWLARKAGAPLAIYGAGALGPVALQAAALDRRFGRIFVSGALASYRLAAEAPVTRNLPEIALPGVLAKYDLPAIVTVLAPRPVVIAEPRDAAGRTLRRSQVIAIFGSAENVTWLAIEPSEGPIP